jgi:hypothetical protein
MTISQVFCREFCVTDLWCFRIVSLPVVGHILGYGGRFREVKDAPHRRQPFDAARRTQQGVSPTRGGEGESCPRPLSSHPCRGRRRAAQALAFGGHGGGCSRASGRGVAGVMPESSGRCPVRPVGPPTLSRRPASGGRPRAMNVSQTRLRLYLSDRPRYPPRPLESLLSCKGLTLWV